MAKAAAIASGLHPPPQRSNCNYDNYEYDATAQADACEIGDQPSSDSDTESDVDPCDNGALSTPANASTTCLAALPVTRAKRHSAQAARTKTSPTKSTGASSPRHSTSGDEALVAITDRAIAYS